MGDCMVRLLLANAVDTWEKLRQVGYLFDVKSKFVAFKSDSC